MVLKFFVPQMIGLWGFDQILLKLFIQLNKGHALVGMKQCRCKRTHTQSVIDPGTYERTYEQTNTHTHNQSKNQAHVRTHANTHTRLCYSREAEAEFSQTLRDHNSPDCDL